MIICKNCGTGAHYTGAPCKKCNTEFTFDEIDIENIREVLLDANRNKQYEEVLECYHILADIGDTEAERKYAMFFEKGSIVPRDFDVACEYFGRAARKNDPYSAYRYSRLIMRDNDATGRFWLIYSAILGSQDAYADTAEEFSAIGNESDANYFYALSAACGNVDAVVTIAKRYYSGIGTSPSPEYAKWYMDKLKIPPIYAIKLAYKLRGVTAQEPPAPMLKNYDALLRRLRAEAESCGFDTAYFRLSEILADRGDIEDAVKVGDALARGRGCKQDLKEGIRLLSLAAAHGNANAHIALGNLYHDGETGEPVPAKAMEHYIRAGMLGSAVGYTICGDICINRGDDGTDFEQAIRYYELAAGLGSAEAREKSDIIKLERENYYKTALREESFNPEHSLNLYSMSAAMGHAGATFKLAECYRLGIGTKKNRRNAFRWYKKATALNFDDAFFPLGVCYAEGYGTNRDFNKAREALISAEKRGDGRAHDVIISLLQRKVKAVSKKLYSNAMRLLYMQKFDDASTCLEIAAELNHPKALYTLGCFYEFGICAPCEKNKAYDLYERAYSLMFRDPQSRYKLIVLKMIKSQWKK